MMFRTAFGIAFLATMLVASAASAQLVPDFDRCNAANPGRYRNQRLPGMANAPLAQLGAAVDQAGCDAAYERISVCGPPVVTPGPNANQVTVTCGNNPRPANTRPRVHNRTIIVCREDMGLRDTENGCELQPGLPSGYSYAIVRLSSERANGHLTERLRVAPHTYQETFGAVAWPNGQPRPEDLRMMRILLAVVGAQEQFARRIEAGERHDVEQDAVIGDNNRRIHRRADGIEASMHAALRNQFRLQFDGSIGGLVHWNAGSPVGGVGGGGILRPGIVLRWNDEFGLRIYGGWGLGGQTNTPYALPNPVGGAPIAQSAPLHMGVFGIDGLFGSGTVAAIFGIDGFVAGRTAPVVVPGTLSGLLAWRANVHAGARIRLAGDSTGFQMNLDLVVNGGVSNVSAVSAGRLFSPTTFGVGGEILIGVTR